MFERFTDRSRRVVVLAQEEARLLDHNWIGMEHFLLAFVSEGEGVAAKSLADVGVADIHALRAAVEVEAGKGTISPSGHIPFTPRGKKMLELSLREALQLGHNYIGTEHMLLGFCRVLQDDLSTSSGRILLTMGVTPQGIRQAVINRLREYGSPKEPTVYDRDPRQRVPSAEKALEGVTVSGTDFVTIDRDELVDGAEDYLVSLRCALWGQAYDMFQKDSRRKAAEFVAETVLGLVKHLEASKK